MIIIIKAIKRDELTLEVEPETLVKDVKQRIEKLLEIPWTNQKLLLLGRNLKDESALSEYSSIRNGTKLTLVEMRAAKETLPDILQLNFRKYFNEEQSKQLTNKFISELFSNISQMNLDDIERLSSGLAKSEQAQ